MSDRGKVTPSHTQRAAIIYVRQSSAAQVERVLSPGRGRRGQLRHPTLA